MIPHCITDNIYPQKIKFEYSYPHSNAFLQFCLKLEPLKAAPHQMRCDIIYDIKLFPTVYHRINCRKFLTSNQISGCKIKCIRIIFGGYFYLAILVVKTQIAKI